MLRCFGFLHYSKRVPGGSTDSVVESHSVSLQRLSLALLRQNPLVMQCDDAFTRNGLKEPSECGERSQICMRLLTSCTLPARFCASRTEVITTIALRLPYYNATTISWQTEKNKWEKQRRLTKDEARLISCLLTQNSKSFQENGWQR